MDCSFVLPVPSPRTGPAASRSRRQTAARRDLISILDYGAGNVRSLENALTKLGHEFKWVSSPEDILAADKLIFPGVGSFGAAMETLENKGYSDALREYAAKDRPFLGICLGLHTLFESSEESPGVPGLGILEGTVTRFNPDLGISVPHMGWNTIECKGHSQLVSGVELERYYFLHSYRVERTVNATLAETTHGEPFVSIVQRGELMAVQFHPEKSGEAGLRMLNNFATSSDFRVSAPVPSPARPRGLAKRIVACLDVRENDQGDLVVTKGDQYDVREKGADRAVRNLGKPVALAGRYYDEGADEVTFLNITSFRGEPLGDAPMLSVLEQASEGVFVPLCIGGGIRDYTDADGVTYSSLEVAARYFRAGADKVSIGSDAVYAAERYVQGAQPDGSSSIEQISHVYGNQAVVVSVDPKRVYVSDPKDTEHVTTEALQPGPNGERFCWYQCTVKGGREGRDLDVVQLVTAVEALGAGEILLNCMDADGTNAGYDIPLIAMVRRVVTIPIIASSGAGKPEHFVQCFNETDVEAALAAGIFHRQEVAIEAVKECVEQNSIPVRRTTEKRVPAM